MASNQIQLDKVREAAGQVAATAMRIYTTNEQRAAVRGGMMDAATLLDVIANRIKLMRKSKRRDEWAALIEMCADEIMLMRADVTREAEHGEG